MISDECCGIWPSEHAYIASQIAEHLPDFLNWLPACCDPELLRDAYEGEALRVWSVPLPDGQVLVFESIRE